MAKVSRLYRVLRLLIVLGSGQCLSAKALAEELHVTTRTVYRDLNLLEMAGVPYYFDEERGGYEIRKSWFMPPVNFTLEEAFALLISGKTGAVALFEQSLHAALLKIRSILPSGMQDMLGDLAPRIERRPDPKGIMNRTFYDQWCHAVRERTAVTIRYESLWDCGRIETDVHPYSICFHRYSWYVIGFSTRHQRVRSFKMARVLEMTVTDVIYQIPDGFSLEKEFGNAWGIMKGDTEHRVRIRFSAKVTPHVRETLWHPTQRITPTPDKGCLFEATVAGTTEILSWILSWGEHAVVEEPPLLRKNVMETLEAQRQQYRKAGA